MTIIRNSAKCKHCGIEIVSTHRHHFVTHMCEIVKRPEKEWYKDSDGKDKIRDKVPFEQTYNFAVDGGNAYLRRIGNFEDMMETSVTENDGDSRRHCVTNENRSQA